MDIGLWTRWLVMHGVPRTFMTIRARRGDPLASLIASHGHGIDPYPLTEQLRTRGPLVRTPFAWASADHGVCREVLRDKRFGVSTPADRWAPGPLRKVLTHTNPGVANPVEPPAMVMVNHPDHTRYRQLVAQSFTPRAIDTLDARVSEVTHELIDQLATKPRPDLIADFAAQLPVAIIAEILGLPADTHPQLLEWGRCGAPLLDIGIGWRTYRRAIDELRGVDGYLSDRFSQIRAESFGDTPFRRMAADNSMIDRELYSNAALLIGAGFETTVNLIGNGIVQLLDHPEQLARLRADPDLWSGAIEEILRFDSPVQLTARTALCAVEIAGQRLRAGETVALLLGGANRDPNVFSDPNRFDITRPNAREHLAFASGVHACLGAALARIEGATALQSLFAAYPGLHLTESPSRRGLVNLHGYSCLPARLGSRTRSTAEL
ncbi:cytochrome P450 [Mycobacterium sp. 852002-51057_SCH5723018]|uniref:cytochrome P450 n=1 Tax=Mycobacterium sp. 852002-51057_SCH5723018 TaxID=1834094 RepID=UPI0007FD5C76|nr:cytochrome P450 [Mycobacterium sp. 852002-51057_SCH5723018]OBG27887.1 cytochrome [Mycobacterium sp. 852002-51057_SCH5723018]